MTDLGRVCSETAFGSEPFSADIAVERPVLSPFDLRVVIAQVLLEVGQLDKSSPAIWEVTLVRPLTCETKRQKIRKSSQFLKFWEW